MTSAPFDVAPLRGDERAAASALLATALHDDPGWAHVVPAPGRRRTALATITGVALRDALGVGRVLAARDAGRLAGVAVWLPPGTYPMDRRRKARAIPAMAGLALRAPRDVRNLARFGDSMDAAFPTGPVWYLQVLGVHPDAQRRGLGRRLVRPVLEAADCTGTTCYLETAETGNVGYYQQMGFTAEGPHAPLYPGGPPITRMSRTPF